tara:strand:- start:149 stop:370 length:222 start_codon:yes stop_codon:yes gene_type:complete
MKPDPTQVAVDLAKADTITCKKCGNASFISTFILKRLSPLVSPTGKESVIPIQVYSCGNCGELVKSLMPDDVI